MAIRHQICDKLLLNWFSILLPDSDNSSEVAFAREPHWYHRNRDGLLRENSWPHYGSFTVFLATFVLQTKLLVSYGLQFGDGIPLWWQKSWITSHPPVRMLSFQSGRCSYAYRADIYTPIIQCQPHESDFFMNLTHRH